ncbi:MAG: tetratricopeptide repeat protein [Deltaproteobacteria bacterium]|nr:tetratricopeptide repeat protein [Deltaproteobacteria bacterium]
MIDAMVHGVLSVSSGRRNALIPNAMLGRRKTARSVIWGAVYCLFLLAFTAGPVFANELDDFARARSAYESQDYALAATLFEALVGGTKPELTNRPLLLESFKYLGASYLFLGRFKDAEEAFERLLREEPSYELDPMAFPAEVQKTFNLVRQRIDWERIQAEREKRRAERVARQQEAKAAARKREGLIRLAALAETESVERVNSRWIAMIPFGVGQYQNNHPNAGTFFAVSEGLLLTLHIVSYFIHQDLEGQKPAEDKLGEARFAEKAFRYTNWVSLAVFGAVLITGIVDAQVRFSPKTTWERRRELPGDIRESLEIEIGASGIGARF